MTNSGFGHLIWLYVAAVALVSFTVYAVMPETRAKTLD
jgi:hypothetical protein